MSLCLLPGSVGNRGHFDEFVFAAPGSKDSDCDETGIKRQGMGRDMNDTKDEECEGWDTKNTKDEIRRIKIRRMKL